MMLPTKRWSPSGSGILALPRAVQGTYITAFSWIECSSMSALYFLETSYIGYRHASSRVSCPSTRGEKADVFDVLIALDSIEVER